MSETKFIKTTDREMLWLAYGMLRALHPEKTAIIQTLLEEHLYPVVVTFKDLEDKIEATK